MGGVTGAARAALALVSIVAAGACRERPDGAPYAREVAEAIPRIESATGRWLMRALSAICCRSGTLWSACSKRGKRAGCPKPKAHAAVNVATTNSWLDLSERRQVREAAGSGFGRCSPISDLHLNTFLPLARERTS